MPITPACKPTLDVTAALLVIAQIKKESSGTSNSRTLVEQYRELKGLLEK